MIDKLSYDEVLKISEEIKKQADIVSELAKKKDLPELIDFTATVEGYSKFLENTIEINKDADKAIAELEEKLRKSV